MNLALDACRRARRNVQDDLRRWPARPRTLLALAALMAGMSMAPAAQAALVVDSATRSVSADTSQSPADTILSLATSGSFSQVASSSDAQGASTATASQESQIGALGFAGSGEAGIGLANNASGQARSLFDVFFTLNSSFSFSGTATFSTDGNASTSASFLLEDGVGADIVGGSDQNPLQPFSGVLGPGSYHLLVQASTASIDPNEGGRAAFQFDVRLVDLDDNPAPVPEPQGVALVAMGLAALGGVRRRRSR